MSPTIVIKTDDDEETVMKKIVDTLNLAYPKEHHEYRINDVGIIHSPAEKPQESSWGIISKTLDAVILSDLDELFFSSWLEIILKNYGFSRVKWSE